jgi:hypothetical protein
MESSKDNINDIEKGTPIDSPERIEVGTKHPEELEEDLKYG